MIGRTLGAYRIVDQIGMGGMATVYKGYDPHTDRYVAIKTLPQQYSNNPDFRTRFENEAKAIARLEHIHILPVFAYGEEDGISYMAMRYLDTGTLKETIEREALSYAQIGKLLRQLASALDYAHDHSIIHRDVKPSNALVDEQGNVYLTDFGIAKIVESSVDLTGTGILGTPQYMSPEQCAGSRDITPASDQYSLGVVLYEMVTRRTPYMAETPMAILQMQILGHPLDPPSTVRDDLPPGVERVILKALSREPGDRFPTCTAMADAYDLALTGAPEPTTDNDTAQLPKTRPANEADVDAATAVGLVGMDAPVEDQSTMPIRVSQPTIERTPAHSGLPTWAIALAALVVIAGLVVFGLEVFDTGDEETAAVAALPTDTPSETPENTNTLRPTREPTATRAPVGITQVAAVSARDDRFGFALQPLPDIVMVTPCDPNDSEASSGICLRDPTFLKLEELLPDVDIDNRWLSGLSFSPDGRQIVFAAQRSDQVGDVPPESVFNNLYVLDLDENTLVELNMGRENAISPSWSPDGEWIAMHLSCRLAVVRPDGSDLTVLRQTTRDDCFQEPQWSPDSHYIVTSWLPENMPSGEIAREVRIYELENPEHVVTVAETRFMMQMCGNMQIAFSPDGQYINYMDENCNAWFAPVNGDDPFRVDTLDRRGGAAFWWMAFSYPQWNGEATTDPIEIPGLGDLAPTDTPEPTATDTPTPTETPEAVGVTEVAAVVDERFGFSLSPSVEMFTLTSCNDDPYNTGLCAEGPAFEDLMPDEDADNYHFNHASYSPDGRQVAFAAQRSDQDRDTPQSNVQFSLYIYDLDTAELVELNWGPHGLLAPTWSPDGEWIAMHMSGDLAIVRPDGSDLTVLAHVEATAFEEPEWSPDSRFIVVSWLPDGWADGAVREVHIYDIENPDDYRLMAETTIVEGMYNSLQVAFSPDGRYINYADGVRRGWIIPVDGSDEATRITQWNHHEGVAYWWQSSTHPQWGGDD